MNILLLIGGALVLLVFAGGIYAVVFDPEVIDEEEAGDVAGERSRHAPYRPDLKQEEHQDKASTEPTMFI